MPVSNTVEIGTWNEIESRELTRCPGYYAADWETLVTTPGKYPLRMTFEDGYMVPMPYWLLCGIAATRKAGATYSGFGGNNFASHEMKKGEAVTYHVQSYAYEVAKMVADGRITLHPGFEWLLEKTPWQAEGAPKTWEAVSALKAAA